MQTLDFYDYLSMLNDETKEYIRVVLMSLKLQNCENIKFTDHLSFEPLFPFFNAYLLLYDYNLPIINQIVNIDINTYNPNNYYRYYFDDKNLEEYFGKLKLMFVNNVEELYMLTPEDFIINLLKDNSKNSWYPSDFEKIIILKRIDLLERISKEKHIKLQDNIDKELFKDMNAEEISYLETAGQLFCYLRYNKDDIKYVDPSNDNLRALSLIASIFLSDSNDMALFKTYLESRGFTFDVFKSLININFNGNHVDLDPSLVLKFYFNKHDINMESIIKDKNLKVPLTKVFGWMNISLDDISSICREIGINNCRIKDRDNIINNIDSDDYKLLKEVFNNYINLNELDVKESIKKKISILLALLNTSDYKEYFNHNGIKYIDIINDLNIDSNKLLFKHSINDDLIDKFINYIDGNDIDIKVFLSDNSYLENYCSINNINYDYLKYELKNKCFRKLTKEEELDRFKSLEVPTLSDKEIPTLASYGSELSIYNNNINNNIISVDQGVSLVEINNLLNKMNKKNNLFNKIFGIQDNIDIELVNNINILIDDNISKLKEELKTYDYLRKYIEVYLIKLDTYLKNVLEKNNYVDDCLSSLDINNISDYTKKLELQSISSILMNKKKTFETSMVLMKQELVKIHQMIVSHFNTINALSMARDDILPLIVSEREINKGKVSENEAIMLSRGLINLFESIIDKNVEETKKNLDLLQNSSIPDNILSKMNEDISLYLNQVESEQKDFKLELKRRDDK